MVFPEVKEAKGMRMDKIKKNINNFCQGNWKTTMPPYNYVPCSETFPEDCTAGMKRYPDKWFDLAIVDPPYGINRSGQTESFTKNSKHKRKYFEKKTWDLAPPGKEYFAELFRVSKNQIIWGANYFPQYLSPSMGWIFWDKGQNLTMSDGELAYTSYKKALRRIIINRNQLRTEGGTIHPTQKPILLYDFCFQYAKVKPGMKVLDTHLGSGSSRIAAYKNRLDFTGFETDREYFEKQEHRFENYIQQLTLF
ncbi:MAG TPA: DNA methyltransferase [Hanamia sp.]|nr:DNA methyltransferase [Hanamia sp.]